MNTFTATLDLGRQAVPMPRFNAVESFISQMLQGVATDSSAPASLCHEHPGWLVEVEDDVLDFLSAHGAGQGGGGGDLGLQVGRAVLAAALVDAAHTAPQSLPMAILR